MSTEINKYRKIAREHFKNNHPLVQKWEAEGVKWDLHHWDTTLRHTNKKRYDMYIIEDLVPMTHSWHQSMHHSNMSEETRKKMSDAHMKEKHPMYGRHLSEEHRKHLSESLKCRNKEWIDKAAKSRSKKVICLETGQIFNSIKEAKKWLGKGYIGACLAGKQKIAGGYHWEYYKE